MFKRFAALAMALALVASSLPLAAGEAEAAPLLLNKLYITADGANVRAAPSLSAAVVGKVGGGSYVMIEGPVQGEEVEGNKVWYKTSSGGYVSETVTANYPGTTNITFRGPFRERWIDINLSTFTARAMQGNTPVYQAKVVTGRPGYDTPIGEFRIQWRARSRTMDSSTVGTPLDAPDAYLVPRVRWAQYFTNEGHAIHGNYWVPQNIFGSGNTSRGCVGLSNADAMVLWDFAGLGTRVSIHY